MKLTSVPYLYQTQSHSCGVILFGIGRENKYYVDFIGNERGIPRFHIKKIGLQF